VLPFDLHVLGMPPAFNLSQDQTLQFIASFFRTGVPKNAFNWLCRHSGKVKTGAVHRVIPIAHWL
jgi:hypothetical protein